MFYLKIQPSKSRAIISLLLPGALALAGCGAAEQDTSLTAGLSSDDGIGEGDVLAQSQMALTQPSSSCGPRPRVRFVGRVDTSEPGVARFAWSGTGVTARFYGTSVEVELGGAQQYSVLIDGELQPKLVVTERGKYPLASGLARGVHEVELYRRVEAHQKESEFYGFDFGSGRALAPSRAAERRIEIIGDSNTCGYGNEGVPPCSYTPDTENHYLSYGAIAARNVGAELSTLCWSGKGVVCNYGDEETSCVDPLPAFLDRTLPERADSVWDPARFQPQAVVINLGSNDISTDVDPTQEEFEAGYEQLLVRTRERYPEALILATLGPLRPERAFLMTYFADAIARRAEAGDSNVMTFELPVTDPANGFGCDGHPSLSTHESLATVLTDTLRTELGW